MKEFYAVATVEWYDDNSGEIKKDTITMTEVENFTDVVSRIENYYGNDLDRILKVELFEGPFIITEEE